MNDLQKLYNERFLPARDEEWHQGYVAAVESAQGASEVTFRTVEFQQRLWESASVANIGPGNSVTVPTAYADPEIIEALWELRNWDRPADPLARARHLDAEFARILALVSPRHNSRRPSARLVRIFATLFPRDILCLMDGGRTAQFRQWIKIASAGFGFIGQQVLAREALREQLGPEKDVAEQVSYSQFSWFVWDTLIAPKDSEPGLPPTGVEDKSAGIATDKPRLRLLPAAMQRKGMFYVTDNLSLLMSLVHAAENGAEREDLLKQIVEDAPTLNANSARNVLAQAVSVGLLSVDGGTYRPTGDARRLMEGEPPANVFVPAMVRGVFGFGLLLGDLREAGGSLSLPEIVSSLRARYPNWTSERAPRMLVQWAKSLDLVAITSGVSGVQQATLTEAGQYWSSGLPADINLPAFRPPQETDDERVVDTTGPAIESVDSIQPPPIDTILASFQESPDLSGFIFSDDQVRTLHAALHASSTKRFVLLAGLSGTGKTSLARVYARAYCEAVGLAPTRHYCEVAVWPDWTDPSGLLGFINPLANPPAFQETPALRFLLNADRDRSHPYFLCLDEMNLARVEHYFAPFLSAMEGGGSLVIHAGGDSIVGVPASINWPKNLFVFGTVNMDETTHPFSDKVLDRAFTFEFWDVDLDAWRARASARFEFANFSTMFEALRALHDALKPARRHFGYRSCDEIAGFCAAAPAMPIAKTLDAAVLAKVLPKLRGDSGGALPAALEQAESICAQFELTVSRAKIQQMRVGLAEIGTARFWA